MKCKKMGVPISDYKLYILRPRSFENDGENAFYFIMRKLQEEYPKGDFNTQSMQKKTKQWKEIKSYAA